MRIILLAGVVAISTFPASAETWSVREGNCGDWQSRWDVEQEQTGVWVGTIDSFHIGGPCLRSNGMVFKSEVRAVISGDNFFALRTAEDGRICTYVARIVRENRGRGVSLCEGGDERGGFVVRFRSQEARPPA